MALRDWPARRIARLWLWGLCAELLILGLGVLSSVWATHSSASPLLAAPPQISAASADSLRQAAESALAAQGIRVHRSADSLIAFAWGDSATVTFRVAGDSIVRLDVTPAAERDIRTHIEPVAASVMASITHASQLVALTAAAIFLPIPLVLVGITVTWLVVRRRSADPPPQVP